MTTLAASRDRLNTGIAAAVENDANLPA